jgi:hypothetical protein
MWLHGSLGDDEAGTEDEEPFIDENDLKVIDLREDDAEDIGLREDEENTVADESDKVPHIKNDKKQQLKPG